ncbi:glycosyltransferase family 2 protein [Vreelandella populi]|uniref:Glycosyltransferase family 2 protein n=1 Tax=Vreelandella populi TaxID=2498858 RepID=A0A3S0ZFK4_9GAMM|nr:glycosyltransferase family A protein [Halomonas populi]RUR35574.1 glycosyltransferase family 2 protein [Halomonas populi]RUR47764.1 glycosyltransferase family 2 protein [Halomonas populi]
MSAISVIIPTHNAEAYLAETVNSLLSQSILPDEIIIIDDGSSDKSLTIARQLSVKFPDIISVYSKTFRSAPKSRNFGASISAGPALMFMDADDVMGPGTLEALSNALDKKGAGVAACSWLRLEKVEENWLAKPASCAQRRPDQDALSAWLTGWYYPTSSILWTREAFDRTGGWDEDVIINQDGDLMMRALAQGASLAETNKGAIYYRKLPSGQESLSGKGKTLKGLKGRMYVLDKIARILEEQDIQKEYKDSLSRAYRGIAQDAKTVDKKIYCDANLKQKKYQPILFKSVFLKGTRWLARYSKGVRGTKPTPEKYQKNVDWLNNVVMAENEYLPEIAKVKDIKFPMVSVIIPVYNRAHLLHRSLDSVVAQTFKDIEILVIDDCSRDDPHSVIKEYNDSRIKYIRQKENQGVAAARNRGLREAKGSFVAFLDDDDEWFPEKLSRQVELFLQSPPEVGLIYTGVETVMDEGHSEIQLPTERGNAYRILLVKNCIHGGSSTMMRRNIITNVGFFDENLLAIEDYDYWLRISRYYHFDFVEEPLVRYHDIRAISTNTDVRRSRNIQANLEARDQFYMKHQAQMKKEGVAHLFLVQSANRHMASHWNDMKSARRLALQAFFYAPTSRNTIVALATTLFSLKLVNKIKVMIYGSNKAKKESASTR